MQTMFCCYYFKRSFSFQVFFDGLQLCLCTILRVPVSLLKCRSSFLLVQCRPFSHVASIDSNSASCFVLAHPSFGACPRSSQSRLCAYFPSGHSYAPSLIDSVSLFSLSLKKGAYHCGRGFPDRKSEQAGRFLLLQANGNYDMLYGTEKKRLPIIGAAI